MAQKNENVNLELLVQPTFIQGMLDSMHCNVLVLNFETKIVLINQQWIDFCNEKCDDLKIEWIGTDYSDICQQITGMSSEETVIVLKGINNIIAGLQNEYELEYSSFRAGVNRWFRFRAKGFNHAKRKWIAISYLEITDQKKSENAHLKSEERYRNLSEATFEAIFFSEDGVFLEQNLTAEKLFGLTISEIISKNGPVWVVPEDRELVMSNILSGYEDPFEATGLRKDGSIFSAEIRGGTVYYKGRNVWVTAVSDISKQKQAEKALHESEEKYRSLFTSANDAIFVMQNDRFITCNPKTLDMFGYKENEIIGHSPVLFSPEYQPDGELSAQKALIRINAALLGEPQFFEWVHQKKDGSLFDAEVSLNKMILSDGEYIHAIVRNITQRKQAEESLRSSELKVRSILNAMDDLVFVLDQENRFISVYASNQKLYKDKEEIIGKTHAEIMPAYMNELFENALLEIRSGNTAGYEYFINLPDGSVSWYALNLSPMISQDKYIGLVAVARNITERKLAEEFLKQSEKRLRDLSNYLDAKHEDERKELAKEIHDGLGQLLTGLKMDIQWIEKKWPQESTTLKNKFISMNKIIDIGVKEVQKLSFQLRPKMLDELGLIETIESEVRHFEGRTGIYCNVKFKPDEFDMEQARSSTIYRVLMELLTNIYRHANATRVEIRLEIKANKCIFTVIDDGVGITQDQIDAKTSFGLLSINERVNVWNGSVIISGEPNKGTTVKVTIPY